jgi:hypothetical protein
MEGETRAEERVSIKKSTIWQIVSGVLAILLVVSIVTGGFGVGKGDVTGQAIRNQPTGNGDTGQPTDIKVSADDDPFLGEKNAPVTIIEFSDFQCPFCQRFYDQTEKLLIDEYVNAGKVKLVYRDFPLNSIHPDAQKSGKAGTDTGITLNVVALQIWALHSTETSVYLKTGGQIQNVLIGWI